MFTAFIISFVIAVCALTIAAIALGKTAGYKLVMKRRDEELEVQGKAIAEIEQQFIEMNKTNQFRVGHFLQNIRSCEVCGCLIEKGQQQAKEETVGDMIYIHYFCKRCYKDLGQSPEFTEQELERLVSGASNREQE